MEQATVQVQDMLKTGIVSLAKYLGYAATTY